MVKQNLPVGAVFEDGGLYFEVQSVLPDGNYISKRIEKIPFLDFCSIFAYNTLELLWEA